MTEITTEGESVSNPIRDSQYEVALGLHKTGQYKQAAEMYVGLEERLGGDFWFRHDEAVALTATGETIQVNKAIALLEGCRRENSQQASIASSLAIAYGRIGRYEECIQAYREALTIDPTNQEASIIKLEGNGDGEELRKKTEELQENGKQQLIHEKNPVNALSYYEAAIALGGEYQVPWAVFDKGVALERMEAYPEAINALQRAKQYLPESAWPDVELGRVYEATGKIAEARVAFKDALRITPANEVAQLALDRVGNVNEIGLLEWTEYAKRRSETLLKNPQAQLDEQQEVELYLSKQSIEYRAELTDFNKGIERPMEEACRVALVIPGRGEGKNIHRTLSQFLNQEDRSGQKVDSRLFEIIIVENHPMSEEKDSTEDEIKRFQEEHPEMKVSYIHKPWKPEEAGVGNARRYGSDLALLRSSEREQRTGELLLISNDADLYGVSNLYISEVISKFDNNKTLDAIAGEWTLPDEYMANPNVRANQRAAYLMERVIQRNFVPGREKTGYNPPKLQGVNSGFRASVYAGIGGFNKHSRLAEDLEIGWMIRAARGGPRTQEHVEKPMRIITDPRRFLAVLAQGTPLVKMYDGFHENPEIRQLDNMDVLKKIPENFDPKMLELNVDAIWQARIDGPYRWYDNFFSLFDRTMKLMGVEYMIEDRTDSDGRVRSHIKVTDTSKLERHL